MLASVAEQIPSEVLDYVLAVLTPEQNNAAMEWLVNEQGRDLQRGLVMACERGIMPMWEGKQPPIARFSHYLNGTSLDDLPYLLDPLFQFRRWKGHPDYQIPLRCELMLEQRDMILAEQAKQKEQMALMQQQAMMTGQPPMPMPAIPELPPPLANLQIFWPLILQLPANIFEEEVGSTYRFFSRDFRKLFKMYAKKELPPDVYEQVMALSAPETRKELAA